MGFQFKKIIICFIIYLKSFVGVPTSMQKVMFKGKLCDKFKRKGYLFWNFIKIFQKYYF